MNKSTINVPSAGTEADSSTKDDNQQVSQPNANTHVVGSPLFRPREFKFRCWDGENMICPDYINRIGYAYWWENGVQERSTVIMQYIGLKDLNKKEIYEGDIIKWGHIEGGKENPVRVAVVKLEPDIIFHILNYSMDFLGQNKHFHYGSFIYTNTEKWLEVIGNVFENPELLEGVQ